jgi:lipopolysaccharide/colanic/teichoic acid biosynthesis glycosyltransferase
MNGKHYDVVKRVLDVCAAFLSLLLLSPLIFFVAILVALFLGRPVFFVQMRVGLEGKPFSIIKFRTMRVGGGSDQERVTVLGRTLRSLSLDELPQLWNVLRGDMSIVGPRPLLLEYVKLYNSEQARRMIVRPGITGLAQVEGRNLLSWADKFALDVFYVDNRSLRLDFVIVAKSMSVIFSRRGVTNEGKQFVEPFKGNGEVSGSAV